MSKLNKFSLPFPETTEAARQGSESVALLWPLAVPRLKGGGVPFAPNLSRGGIYPDIDGVFRACLGLLMVSSPVSSFPIEIISFVGKK